MTRAPIQLAARMTSNADIRSFQETGREARKVARSTWLLCGLLSFALLIWLFGWYGDTTLSTIAIWKRSETYAHGFLIFPISAYLIWTRRSDVLALKPDPSVFGIIVLLGLGFLWLIAETAGALVVSQYAVVAMVPAIVWGVLGFRVTLALLFPFLFLLFAVPAGDFLLTPMMNLTADFTVAALRITGIPVFREGNFFTVPSGSWSVVEACSGLRYLIASVTLGCLFAYLTYQSFWRRAAFIGLSILVPIVANWIRAYMIVMIGHLSSNRLATGVDHVIYGWAFFGFVMMLLFWFGSRWGEDVKLVPSAPQNQSVSGRAVPHLSARVAVFATIAAFAVVIWPSLALRINDAPPNLKPLVLSSYAAPDGWQTLPGSLTEWEPHFSGHVGSQRQTFENGTTQVDVLIKYYRNQHQDAELINSKNQLVVTRNPVWGLTSEGAADIQWNRRALLVNNSTLRSTRSNLLVFSWYWIGGAYTSNIYLAKVFQAKAKLLGQGDDAAAIFVYVPFEGKPDDAKEVLRKFIPSMFDGIDRILNEAKH